MLRPVSAFVLFRLTVYINTEVEILNFKWIVGVESMNQSGFKPSCRRDSCGSLLQDDKLVVGIGIVIVDR